MTTTKDIAMIGTREPTKPEAVYVQRLAQLAASRGFKVRSGNADGVDYVAALAASSVNPSSVRLYLPWQGYNYDNIPDHTDRILAVSDLHETHLETLTKICETHYPHWEHVGDGVKKLMIRNAAIIFGATGQTPVQAVIAVPRQKLGEDEEYKGGTGFGMILARVAGIPLFDLTQPGGIQAAKAWLEAN